MAGVWLIRNRQPSSYSAKQEDERRVQEPVDANCMIDVVADPLGPPITPFPTRSGPHRCGQPARNVRGCLPKGSRLPGPITRLNVLGDGFAAICHGDMQPLS